MYIRANSTSITLCLARAFLFYFPVFLVVPPFVSWLKALETLIIQEYDSRIRKYITYDNSCLVRDCCSCFCDLRLVLRRTNDTSSCIRSIFFSVGWTPFFYGEFCVFLFGGVGLCEAEEEAWLHTMMPQKCTQKS